MAPSAPRADAGNDRPLAGSRLEPGAARGDGGDRLSVRGQRVAVDRLEAAASVRSPRAQSPRAVTRALPGGRPGSAQAIESPPLVAVVSSGRSLDAQVFRASARHRKRDPVGCGEVLSALILILAAWLFGVPVATMAVDRTRHVARQEDGHAATCPLPHPLAAPRGTVRRASGMPSSGEWICPSPPFPVPRSTLGRRHRSDHTRHRPDHTPHPWPNPRARDARSRRSITRSTSP